MDVKVDKDDKKEIERLIEFKNYILWYRKLSKEEKEKLIFSRWQ